MSGRGASTRTGFALALLDQLRLDLGGKIDRAAAADVVEMGIEETPGRALPELAQHLEIFVVGLERAARAEGFAQSSITMRWSLRRRNSPGRIPRGNRPSSMSRLTKATPRSSERSEALKLISLMRLMISRVRVGTLRRSRGLI